ncbi:ABC transporter substrate-binding protein [Telmatospirillum sp. J64-1]|uniref:ABC transporter substrate-binding protein n=1 Tax=Telmatospirillum sp. J64-1 TaxID=2502183 RepID=UPI00115EAAE8|nr:ABC transporter substrate-binding protein [Telmatospirillum sp. J64-1]
MRKLIASLAGLMALGLAGQAQAEKTLVVYTSQPTNQMEEVLKLFNEKHPDIKVELFRSGTTEIMNKLQAEIAAGEPRADVMLIADSVAMQELKNQDLLMPYEDAPVAGYHPSQYDPDKTFFGTKLITTGIMYNTASGLPKPTSWKDLLKPEAKGQVILPSPLYSGAAAIHVGTMAADPAFGWDYFDALAENDATATRGNGGVRDAVARGEKAYGIIIEYMAYEQKAQGSPVDFVFPEEGVTTINQPVAILKTAKNVDEAKAFIDFQLSREAQIQSVAQQYFPLLEGVEPPAGYPDPAGLKIMSADPDLLLKGTEETKRKFADLFGG